MSEQIEAAWKLDGISPRAYQHPADRAARAALAKVPYLDQVVRRLVALGYERALRAAARRRRAARPGAAAAHLGAAPAGLQRARHGARAGPLPDPVPAGERGRHRDRQADRGAQLGARADPRRGRAPRRSRPRGRARPLRPRPLSDRPADPAAARLVGTAAGARGLPAARDSARAARVVARGRAPVETAPRRS